MQCVLCHAFHQVINDHFYLITKRRNQGDASRVINLTLCWVIGKKFLRIQPRLGTSPWRVSGVARKHWSLQDSTLPYG
jgi:hypothetical protein